MPASIFTVDNLHRAKERAKRMYRARRISYDEMRAAIRAYKEIGEHLRTRLPFETYPAYAYNPHEHATSNGGMHIVTREDFKIRRLKRERGDALCKRARDFWGLDGREPGERLPTCKTCLDRAARYGTGDAEAIIQATAETVPLLAELIREIAEAGADA